MYTRQIAWFFIHLPVGGEQYMTLQALLAGNEAEKGWCCCSLYGTAAGT
jgi:hypothetical protein